MEKRKTNRSVAAGRSSGRRRHASTAPKAKPFIRSLAKRANRDDVQLIPGQTTTTKEGKRLFWRVLFLGKSAGRVRIDCASRGDKMDASIDVQLNQASRGRGIGTIVFQRASELSGLPEVLATIRKGNIASQIAARRAGFVASEDQRGGELVLIWRNR
jgi:hypothetical protein